MPTAELAPRRVTVLCYLALCARLNLNPEVKKRVPFLNRLAVEVNSDIGFCGNGANQAFAAQTSGHIGRAVVALQSVFVNRRHRTCSISLTTVFSRVRAIPQTVRPSYHVPTFTAVR